MRYCQYLIDQVGEGMREREREKTNDNDMISLGVSIIIQYRLIHFTMKTLENKIKTKNVVVF